MTCICMHINNNLNMGFVNHCVPLHMFGVSMYAGMLEGKGAGRKGGGCREERTSSKDK